MQSINSLSLTSSVNDWLANSHHPGILHVFDHACNLINEGREVLSIVTPQIGNGPFNLVIQNDVLFSGCLSIESPLLIFPDQLHLGDLLIHTARVKDWNALPDWKTLHRKQEKILFDLLRLQIPDYLSPTLSTLNSLSYTLSYSISAADISTAKDMASQVAGMGIGLTPSGDDFLMGAIYAAWIIHPQDVAQKLAQEIAETAAPLTTSLSAAWLKSAGRGEAGILWHKFFKALIADENIQLPITKLLSVGETSGADALAGFFGIMNAFKERIISECPS